MHLSIIIPCLIAFLGTFFVTPYFIKKLRLEGIVGHDQMKKGKPKIPEMGAPSVIFGFISGIFAYIFAQTFFIQTMSSNQLLYLLAAITTIIILAFIGVLDELTCLIKENQGKKGFKAFKRIGLKKRTQTLLPLPAAIPLIAVSAGVTALTIPIFGYFDFGIIYPLIIIPLAITGAANATNMLAGFNGLETGIGIVLLSFLGYFAYISNSFSAALLAFVFAASLIAFLIYNWYPAKIFPGGLTYVIGAAIATVAIIGQIQRFALLCFAPFFIELILKAKTKFKAENFGTLQKDGTLKAPKKAGSLTHVVMKMGKFKEHQVSTILILSFAVWCLFVLMVI